MTTTEKPQPHPLTIQFIGLLKEIDREDIPDILFELSHSIKQDQEKVVWDLRAQLAKEESILTKLKGV